jgi:hypothetical protein
MRFVAVVRAWQGAGQSPATPGVALTLRATQHMLYHSIPRGGHNVLAPVF